MAGGRDFDDYKKLSDEISRLAMNEYKDRAVSIVSGMARGADHLAVRFARNNEVMLHELWADWKGLGKGAGFVRNRQMADFADGLLAFWDGQSHGTKHMIDTMTRMGKPVHIIYY